MGTSKRQRIVVVGHGMVGHRFAQAAAERGLTETHDVLVIGEEPRAAYDRVALTSWFGHAADGAGAEALSLLPGGEYDDPRVRLVIDSVVTGIDRKARTVTVVSPPSAAGDPLGDPLGDPGTVTTHEYDVLVLATGAAPFVPPVEGRGKDGCFVYRTIEDLEAIRCRRPDRDERCGHRRRTARARGGQRPRAAGPETNVVEMAPRLMPVQLDGAAGSTLVRHIEKLGVKVHTGVVTEEIEGGDRVTGLRVRQAGTDEGAPTDVIATQVVVFSAGIRPRDALARECDLDVAPRGGVLVDEQCRTADPHIFAIGECAAPGGTMYGLVAPGYAMAEVVVDALLRRARHLHRRRHVHQAQAARHRRRQLRRRLRHDRRRAGADVLRRGERRLQEARRERGRHAVARRHPRRRRVGVRRSCGRWSAADSHCPTTPSSSSSPAGSGVQLGMPDEAQVCSCNDVTKADILHAVAEQGCEDVAAVKACTRAGSTCGSCVPTVKNLIEEHFASVGKVVDKGLCEHFRLSRQELFDVVAVHGYRRFDDIVEAHGTGRGCDICKPAIASILASQTSTHILERETAGLQDTNDAYLANIQRNGTYSVVPRIPGGEITPEKLIVIGEVARDFGLYTKITGGQRIDLFGARLEQLPVIWRRLVDAGFESGHAYGKSLRTVKSCVGSTWCRYGVQDSVGLAIALELRYRGLRSPHKLKGGVSGCARECAEARGKDFGVIATEKGWNLYVGGNGGATPPTRGSSPVTSTPRRWCPTSTASSCTTSAPPTACSARRTWIEHLEGGLDRVREVVVDDSLGLGAELEAEMGRHVGGYADEWAATLEDPEKLARFVTFVNAPDTPDPSIAFTTEREQIQPIFPALIPVGAPS